MFSNLQIRTAKPHRRKPSLAARAGVSKRRVSHAFTTPNEVPSISFMENLFGEEFPEAFATSDGRAIKSRKSILNLPAEVLALIAEYLGKLDLKKLRLASKYLATNVNLCIDRVYISPNRANLERLYKIINQPRYKYQVREIVWDESQLENYPDLDSFRDALNDDASHNRHYLENLLAEAISGYDDASADYRTFEVDDFFDNERLTEAGKSILLQYDNPLSRQIMAQHASPMSVEESFNVYQRLYREEQNIMSRQIDMAALQHALAELPNIRRITLTSEVWRPWHLNPIYDTPFYRSLPPGFQKPSVYPWLGERPASGYATNRLQASHRERTMNMQRIDKLGSEWHGYKTVIAVLSELQDPRITEFIIDSGCENTGICHQLFAAPNNDLDLTIRMADNLPLKRLTLSINSHWTENRSDSNFLFNGHLKTLFEHMPHLEHLDFNPQCQSRNMNNVDRGDRYMEWQHMFPIDMVKRLKSFALRNAGSRSDNLIGLLMKLENVERITLDNINIGNHYMQIPSDWPMFFYRLKQQFSQRFDSPNDRKPQFTLILPFQDGGYGTARVQFIDEEITAFLDGDLDLHSPRRTFPSEDIGWIVDDRDPGIKIKSSQEYWNSVYTNMCMAREV